MKKNIARRSAMLMDRRRRLQSHQATSMSSCASRGNLSAIKPTCWEEAAAHGEVTMQLPPGHERTIERTNPKLLRTLTRPFPARAAQLLPVTVSRAAVLKQRPRKNKPWGSGTFEFVVFCY
jgi:hypothetical protein